MGFGLPALVFGLWSSGFGLPALVFGLWSLGFGLRASVFGLWSSGFGLQATDFGLRAMGFGLRAVVFKYLVYAISRLAKKLNPHHIFFNDRYTSKQVSNYPLKKAILPFGVNYPQLKNHWITMSQASWPGWHGLWYIVH